jgi:hypothetical protein
VSIDFDAVVRDPNHPGRLLPRLASEDHLHPNDAGYQAMADAIDLSFPVVLPRYKVENPQNSNHTQKPAKTHVDPQSLTN